MLYCFNYFHEIDYFSAYFLSFFFGGGAGGKGMENFCCVDNHLLVQDLYSMSPFFFKNTLCVLICAVSPHSHLGCIFKNVSATT